MEDFTEVKAIEYFNGETNKTLVVAPIILFRKGDRTGVQHERETDEYMGLYIGLVPVETELSVSTVDANDWKLYVLIVGTLCFVLSATTLCIY